MIDPAKRRRIDQLQPCSFGQIYPEPVAAALISAGHFDGRVTKLLLDIPLVDYGVCGKPGAQ